MAKTSTRNIKLVGFAGLGVLTVGGIVLAIVPLVGQLGSSNEDIDAANQQTSQLRTQIQQLQGVQDNVAQVDEFKNDFVAKFPETAQVPDLITSIANAAVQAGIPASDITNYGFQAPAIGSAATSTGGTTGSATTGATTSSGTTGTTGSTTPSTAPSSGTGSTGSGTTSGSLGGATTGQAASMTLNLTVQGNTRKFAAFMSNLTDMDRNFSITTFAVAGGTQESPSTLTMTGRTLLYSHITTPQEATTSTGTGTGSTGSTSTTPSTAATTAAG